MNDASYFYSWSFSHNHPVFTRKKNLTRLQNHIAEFYSSPHHKSQFLSETICSYVCSVIMHAVITILRATSFMSDLILICLLQIKCSKVRPPNNCCGLGCTLLSLIRSISHSCQLYLKKKKNYYTGGHP